jgi:hypothetical protein
LEEQYYYYSKATVNTDAIKKEDGSFITPAEFQSKKLKFFLVPTAASGIIKLAEFMFFSYVETTNGEPLTPLSQVAESTETKTYFYYEENELKSKNNAKDLVEYAKLSEEENYGATIRFKPVFYDDSSKVRSITGKESNYFNLLQSVAETF